MGASEPPNFSWVVEGQLAGLAMPREPGHYRFLLRQGVRHLVSLSERAPPHHGCCPAVQLHRLRVPDFSPPTPEQIQSFLQLVEEANARRELPVCRCWPGCGGALPAGTRPDGHHAGLLPGEGAEDEWRRCHPGDPAAAAWLHRDAGAGASRDSVLPAHLLWRGQ
ncbi:dual specificity protein phosphatase 23 isoform X4 [Phalacrocorax aristotelis]|uniref:dual specificity protein phosphatase 23 isoform X4 n=1 Tax=Phalacrocorax aristotelis TaxID=126867 RepID=UPI003F4C6281